MGQIIHLTDFQQFFFSRISLVSGEAGCARKTTQEKYHMKVQPFNLMHNHKEDGHIKKDSNRVIKVSKYSTYNVY
jgi:hypothetical protein